MKKYYIYDIRNEFKYVFKNREKAFLEFINEFVNNPTPYLEKQADLILNKFNTQDLIQRFNQYFDDNIYNYRQLAHLHVLEDLTNHQLSYLKIDKYHLILEAEDYYSSFLKVVLQGNGNYVIIDFDENDCIWLDSITSYYEYGG